MQRLAVAPRTPEWSAIRAESWTSSAAATLVCRDNAVLLRDYAATKGVTLDIDPLLEVGLTSFFGNTLWQAWAEKMGRIPRFQGTEQAERGRANVELVVQLFESEKLRVVEREVTARSSMHPGILASFGALAPASSDPAVAAPHGFPVEARCLPYGSRKKLFDSEKAGQLYIKGLPYYWCQLQHQILVAEAPYGWFMAAGVEEDDEGKVVKTVFPVLEKVPRDDRFLAAYVAAANFYHQEFLENYVEPPKLPSDEALLRKLTELATFNMALTEANFDVAVGLYLAARAVEIEAEDRRKNFEAQLLKSAEAMRSNGNDVVVLDRLQIVYSKSSAPVGWQKVAKALAAKAGLTDIPRDVIEACMGKAVEKVKLLEVV